MNNVLYVTSDAVIEDERPCVYVMNVQGKASYVGKTKNVGTRLKQHFYVPRQGKLDDKFYDQVDSVDLYWFDSMKVATVAEIYLITRLRPEMNTVYLNGNATINFDISVADHKVLPRIEIDAFKPTWHKAIPCDGLTNFSKNVKAGRLANGLSMIELAEAAGITRQEVHKIESMKLTGCTLSVVAKIANVFGVPDYFMLMPDVEFEN
jgi:predicted GIY-YIG superfamily endonuclease/DNA-binding XRE family transcriptional regulator